MKKLILTFAALFLFQPSAFAIFANGTLVTTPEGKKAIEQFIVGNSISTRAGNSTVRWHNGTGSSSRGMMTFLQFENGTQLAASIDQPILLADGNFIQARDLIPGQKVLSEDGSPVAVISLSAGMYYGAVHGLAVERFSGDLAKNTISANGILVGDLEILVRCYQICINR